MALGLAVLVTVVLIPGLLRLQVDNSPHVFFVEGSAKVEEYGRFLERFGSDKALADKTAGELKSKGKVAAFAALTVKKLYQGQR